MLVDILTAECMDWRSDGGCVATQNLMNNGDT